MIEDFYNEPCINKFNNYVNRQLNSYREIFNIRVNIVFAILYSFLLLVINRHLQQLIFTSLYKISHAKNLNNILKIKINYLIKRNGLSLIQ